MKAAITTTKENEVRSHVIHFFFCDQVLSAKMLMQGVSKLS